MGYNLTQKEENYSIAGLVLGLGLVAYNKFFPTQIPIGPQSVVTVNGVAQTQGIGLAVIGVVIAVAVAGLFVYKKWIKK